jgi:putative membrane protein
MINTLAVLVAGYLVTGIHHEKTVDLFMASLLLGICNAVLRPFLMLLTFPLVLFTLGLFRFVINGCLLYFVGWLLHPRFMVAGFWDAFWGALIISLVSSVLNYLTGTNRARIKVERRGRSSDSDPGGHGPVIDV